MKILISLILGILFITAAVGLKFEYNYLSENTNSSTTDTSATASTDKPTTATDKPTTTSTDTPTTAATTATDTPTTASTDTPTTSAATTASTDTPTTSAATTASKDTPTTSAATTASTDTPTTSAATTASTDTSTTEAPTTSTAASTTKAPQPTPPPAKHCSWNVTQNNVTCMRIDIQAIFVIHIQGSKEYIALSENATADQSDCSVSNDTQRLVLSELNYYTLTMTFVKEDNKVFVNETTFEYKLPQGDGSTSSDSKLFAVKFGNSYMCKTEAEVQLNNVTMELYDVQIQAFGEQANTNFGSAEECEADDKVSDAVPIAVGCALAALIIIVLIAYLAGRRRSRQRGYQSV